MPLIDHDDKVQAFSANASDHPFRIAVLPRTPSRYRNLPDTHSINSRGEVVSVDPITIAHQVARHSVVGKCLHELLCRPCGSRLFRDIEMQNTSTVMRKDDENVQHTELQSRNGEEVERDHLADVISKKGHPGLRWLARFLGHPARHRTFRDREPQFFQFTIKTDSATTERSPPGRESRMMMTMACSRRVKMSRIVRMVSNRKRSRIQALAEFATY